MPCAMHAAQDIAPQNTKFSRRHAAKRKDLAYCRLNVTLIPKKIHCMNSSGLIPAKLGEHELRNRAFHDSVSSHGAHRKLGGEH